MKKSKLIIIKMQQFEDNFTKFIDKYNSSVELKAMDVYICGGSGCGKSYLAQILNKSNPELSIYNVDEQAYIPKSPVVLVANSRSGLLTLDKTRLIFLQHVTGYIFALVIPNSAEMEISLVKAHRFFSPTESKVPDGVVFTN